MSKSTRMEADDFLRRYRRGLGGLPPDLRDDLVRELRSHFEQRLAQGSLDLGNAFGTPEEYAARFVDAQAFRSGVMRDSPLKIVAVLLGRVRMISMILLAVLPLLALEVCGIVLAVVGACKPFNAEHIGLFFDQNSFGALGWIKDPAGMQEVLGFAAMPSFISVGLLVFWACNRLLVALARRQIVPVTVPN